MSDKPVNPRALSAILIRKFVEIGLLNEKRTGTKTLYFLTEQGRIILANFGINEGDLYEKPK